MTDWGNVYPEEGEPLGHEDARRLSRYDRAVALLREQIEGCGCGMPKPCDAEEIIERIREDAENVDDYCDLCVKCATFLSEEPTP